MADAHHLPFDDSCFDIVTAHSLLCYLKDPVSAIKEFVRVTRPGGVIALRENSVAALVSLKPDLPGLQSFWPFALKLIAGIGIDIHAGQKLKDWAEEAGISDDQGWKVRSSKSTLQLPSFGTHLNHQSVEMALKHGLASEQEIDAWRKAWKVWENDDKAELLTECGELLMWKPEV